jgi:hypothetical protein
MKIWEVTKGVATIVKDIAVNVATFTWTHPSNLHSPRLDAPARIQNDSVAKSSEGRELAELRRFLRGDAEQLAILAGGVARIISMAAGRS